MSETITIPIETYQSLLDNQRATILRDHLPEIIDMVNRNITYREIGDMFGVSRQRVYQLCSQYIGKKNLSGPGSRSSTKAPANTTTRIAQDCEEFVCQQIRSHGHEAELQPNMSPFDILVNNKTRVEVKSGTPLNAYAHRTYRFNVGSGNKRDDIDYYALVAGESKYIFIVPVSAMPKGVSIAITWPLEKTTRRSWAKEYLSRYDLLERTNS